MRDRASSGSREQVSAGRLTKAFLHWNHLYKWTLITWIHVESTFRYFVAPVKNKTHGESQYWIDCNEQIVWAWASVCTHPSVSRAMLLALTSTQSIPSRPTSSKIPLLGPNFCLNEHSRSLLTVSRCDVHAARPRCTQRCWTSPACSCPLDTSVCKDEEPGPVLGKSCRERFGFSSGC